MQIQTTKNINNYKTIKLHQIQQHEQVWQHVNASKQVNNNVELKTVQLQHGAEPKPSIMYREAKVVHKQHRSMDVLNATQINMHDLWQ